MTQEELKLINDKDLLHECLGAFDALSSFAPARDARKFLRRRGTPAKVNAGNATMQLAVTMATVLRKHLA